uniref:EF-hand domain-containing protein n=1 Tax=Dunaliella tertiolecta TaxID=3047 RepID=A0A7S3QZQ8_DUNTE
MGFVIFGMLSQNTPFHAYVTRHLSHVPSWCEQVELSDAEVKEFREIFDFMDRDKGGTLGIQEIKQLTDMLGMRISPDELDNIMKQIDADNSGQVDFDEFLQVMARPQQLPYTRKDVLRAFAMFAKNGEPEGYINPEKLEEALVSC